MLALESLYRVLSIGYAICCKLYSDTNFVVHTQISCVECTNVRYHAIHTPMT